VRPRTGTPESVIDSTRKNRHYREGRRRGEAQGRRLRGGERHRISLIRSLLLTAAAIGGVGVEERSRWEEASEPRVLQSAERSASVEELLDHGCGPFRLTCSLLARDRFSDVDALNTWIPREIQP
jgi:hypothetical protein